MAEACPFSNFEEMILFLANNVRTGGDNQILYDGRERSGKTTLARTVNRYLYQILHGEDIRFSQAVDSARRALPIVNPRYVAEATASVARGFGGRKPTYLNLDKREWDFLENVVFDFKDWNMIYGRGDDFGLHQADEAGNLLFSRNAMTGENKQVIQTVQMCGVRHATFSWVLPNKHWMDPYIREHRATVWGHVHTAYTLHGMTRGLATFHWRQDNYMTGNVWWSDPIFWHKFQEMPNDSVQRGYDAIKLAKLYESTMALEKGRK